MDSLKVAVANLCDLLDRQLELLVDEKFNAGLTPNLIPRFAPDHPEAGIHHGFKGMQLCCSAMTAEAMKLSNPATIHSRSTECHNQDKVSMGSIAARDARTIVEIAQNIAAVHLIASCQALELRGVDQASPRTVGAFRLVREHVAFLDRDRYLDVDIAATVDMIQSGVFSRVRRLAGLRHGHDATGVLARLDAAAREEHLMRIVERHKPALLDMQTAPGSGRRNLL